MSRKPLNPAARVVLILLILGISVYLLLLFLLGKDAERDGAVKSDAILVLGSRAYVDGRINACLKARVAQGVDLLERGYGKFLILSGGDDVEDGVNEAETMRLLALQMGAPQSQILLERRATSTFENLNLSRPILEKNKLSSLIIVTEPFHQVRSSWIARKQNLNFTLSPALDSFCWTRWKYGSRFFLREPFAALENWFKGYL
jgi:uncharacterized SAM-binding protein YcdF (DUF218 family)